MKRKFLSAAAVAAVVLSLSTVNHAQPAADDQKSSADKFQVEIDDFSFQLRIPMMVMGDSD